MKGTRIAVETFAPAKLLTALVKEGIPVGDAVKNKGTLAFTVRERYAQKTFAFLQSLCYTYSVVSSAGPRASLRKALPRLGLLAGIVLAAAAYWYAGRFVWRVEVAGNERMSDKAVVETLAACGVKKGSRLDFDRAAIEKAMREADGISECSLSIRGTTLTVTVIERAEITPPESDDVRADIVSAFDATVTRIVCERGTPRVKAGDKIAAGATLIEGASYTTLGDDYGEPVLMQEFRAQGKVYGAVVYKRSIAVPEIAVRYERTGRKKTKTVLSLGKLRIGKSACGFASCETEVTSERLAFLAIECTRYRCYETAAVETETDPELTARQVLRELTDEAAIRQGKILSSTHNYTRGNGMYYINCYVTAEMPIGELRA